MLSEKDIMNTLMMLGHSIVDAREAAHIIHRQMLVANDRDSIEQGKRK